MAERLVEGLWDCSIPGCKTKGISGLQQSCPNCGKARDANTRFYLPEHKRYLSKEESRDFGHGPDWLCDYCGQLSPAREKECIHCGGTRTAENLDYFQLKAQVGAAKSQPQAVRLPADSYENMGYGSSESDNEQNHQPERVVRSVSEDSFETNGKMRHSAVISSLKSINWISIISVLLVVAMIVGLVYIFMPKEQELTVSNVYWERNVDIEEYRTVDESGWEVPIGGRVKYTREEFHHFDSVQTGYETKFREVTKRRFVGTIDKVVGYEDNGDGTFTEITVPEDVYETYTDQEPYEVPKFIKVPVNQTKYYYEIERWVYARTATASAPNKQPEWPSLNLAENERERSRNETYTVTGKDEDGEKHTFTLSYADWKQVHVGQVITVELSFGHGELISVDGSYKVLELE